MTKTAAGSGAGATTGRGQKTRRTQAERRAESRQAVLDSALRIFGEKGYADTSLEDIAADCGLTIRPIYHYFKNKKGLFCAVNDVMEQRIVDAMRVGEDGVGLAENWRAYLELCDDPAFRRVVLVDSPNILGRERWANSPVSIKARDSLGGFTGTSDAESFRGEFLQRVMMAAFTEAALCVADAEDLAMARREAEQLMSGLFQGLQSQAGKE